VFSGTPVVKISEAGTNRVAEKLTPQKALNFGCLVSKIGGKYYWATRENKQLIRVETTGLCAFLTPDGAGYVPFVKPEAKRAAALVSDTEANFNYVEHLLLGLTRVTYFGTSNRE
jgi:hypothetical protein